MKKIAAAAAGCLALCSGALGVNVLVLSSDIQAIDDAVVAALQAGGHTVTVGPDFNTFTDAVDLNGIDAIYFQANANYSNGDMPDKGQQAILDFVNGGGGLVTCEWVVWKVAAQGYLKQLAPMMPGAYHGFDGAPSETFTLGTNDPVLSKGVPDSFEVTLDNYGGTESSLVGKCGATEYYHCNLAGGVLGWNFGIGRVLSFATTNGPTEVADKDFAKLLSNAMKWASLGGGPPPPPNYADCDQSGVLDLFDFLCFTNAFNAAQAYADCDGDGTYSLFDFLCFVNSFNQGC